MRRLVRLALEEDIGTGDLTTDLVVPEGILAAAEVVAKEAGVLAGGAVAMAVLEEVDPAIRVRLLVEDGGEVAPGTVVLRAEGPARSLLVAERTLLDFLMRLSGVATAARAFAGAVEGTGTVPLDTRKSTPGYRVLEKHAVRVGGARNHRMSLASGVLIKNNHLAMCDGDVAGAVRRARAGAPLLAGVEVECRTPEEVDAAVGAGADVVMLDHMPMDQVAAVVARHRGRARFEVSGDVTPATASAAAAAGVDYVSTGAVTHHAPWLDFGMCLTPVR